MLPDGLRTSCHSFGPVYIPLPQTFVLSFPVLDLPDSSQAIHTKWIVKFEGGGLVTESCPTLWTPRTVALCPWESPGKKAGVGCHAPFQGIFPTQGSNLGCLHCRQILYHLSHQGSLDVAIQLLNMFRVYIQKICIKYQSHKEKFLCPRVDDVYCKQPATKSG